MIDFNANAERVREAAQRIRTNIADIHGANPTKNIILAPSAGIALNILFAHIGVGSLALSSEEYYNAEHFGNLDVGIAPAGKLAQYAIERRPDAVIVSSVSWRGKRFPVAAIFEEIKQSLGESAPLLVCDNMHGGAAGFPNVESFEADLVFGDVYKWITPMDWEDRIVFLWLSGSKYEDVALNAFRPFFAATEAPHIDPSIGWLGREGRATLSVARYLEEAPINSSILLQRHESNLRFASELAYDLELPDPETAIVWLPTGARENTDIDSVPSPLIWNRDDGGARILCRADVLPEDSKYA